MKRTVYLLAIIFVFGLVIRLYQLSITPPALNWDEASLGYNAYLISQTLKDEHGEFLPISRFIAYGDYKPPLYIYVTAVSVKLFGLSEFSTRLPSAVAGSILVVVTFFITSELLWWWRQKATFPFPRNKTCLAAAFLVAISPWTMQLSRGAYEGNLATLFSGIGIYFLLRLLRNRSIWPGVFCALFMAAAMYTFNTHRVFVPLIIFAILTANLKRIFHDKRLFWGVATLVGVLFLLVTPMIPHLLSAEGRLRFEEVSWTKDTSLVETANNRIARDNGQGTIPIFDNRRIEFALTFTKHLSDHFSANYLFFQGDKNPRLSTQDVGEFYLIEIVFLLLGIFYVLKLRGFPGLAIGLWIFLGLVPGALARETPHALRTLNLVPVPQVVAAIGLIAVLNNNRRRLIMAVIAIAYSLLFLVHLHEYLIHYRVDYANDWQYGYKEMVSYVSSVEKKYDHILVTGKYGRPYIYFLFFKQYSPEKYWVTKSVSRDQFGFWTVNGFDKYFFGDAPKKTSKSLVVWDNSALPVGKVPIKTITEPSGQVVFQIYEN